MTRKIVSVSVKDDSGAYLPPSRVESSTEPPASTKLSIDEMLQEALSQLHMLLRYTKEVIRNGQQDTKTVSMLKDVTTLLFEMKDREKELLDDLTDEELREIAGDQ